MRDLGAIINEKYISKEYSGSSELLDFNSLKIDNSLGTITSWYFDRTKANSDAFIFSDESDVFDKVTEDLEIVGSISVTSGDNLLFKESARLKPFRTFEEKISDTVSVISYEYDYFDSDVYMKADDPLAFNGRNYIGVPTALPYSELLDAYFIPSMVVRSDHSYPINFTMRLAYTSSSGSNIGLSSDASISFAVGESVKYFLFQISKSVGDAFIGSRTTSLQATIVTSGTVNADTTFDFTCNTKNANYGEFDNGLVVMQSKFYPALKQNEYLPKYVNYDNVKVNLLRTIPTTAFYYLQAGINLSTTDTLTVPDKDTDFGYGLGKYRFNDPTSRLEYGYTVFVLVDGVWNSLDYSYMSTFTEANGDIVIINNSDSSLNAKIEYYS